jgi:hypothetical protein
VPSYNIYVPSYKIYVPSYKIYVPSYKIQSPGRPGARDLCSSAFRDNIACKEHVPPP